MKGKKEAFLEWKNEILFPQATPEQHFMRGWESCAGSSDQKISTVEWQVHLLRWNELAEKFGYPKVQKLTPARRQKLKARLRDEPDWWARVEKALSELNQWAKENLRVTLDWVSTSQNSQKLIEGNFSEKTQQTSSVGKSLAQRRLEAQRESQRVRHQEWDEANKKALSPEEAKSIIRGYPGMIKERKFLPKGGDANAGRRTGNRVVEREDKGGIEFDPDDLSGEETPF